MGGNGPHGRLADSHLLYFSLPWLCVPGDISLPLSKSYIHSSTSKSLHLAPSIQSSHMPRSSQEAPAVHLRPAFFPPQPQALSLFSVLAVHLCTLAGCPPCSPAFPRSEEVCFPPRIIWIFIASLKGHTKLNNQPAVDLLNFKFRLWLPWHSQPEGFCRPYRVHG